MNTDTATTTDKPAKVSRASRSRYLPHVGKKQAAKLKRKAATP